MKRLVTLLLITSLAAGTVFAQAVREQQAANVNNQERNIGRERPNRTEETNRQERQNRSEQNNRQNERGRQREANAVTVEGTLQLQRGMVAVASGDTIYTVPMLTRYIGFISELNEGARVTVEGTRIRNNIQPTRVTIAGKSYEFDAPQQNMDRRQNNDRQRPPQQNSSRNRRDTPNRGGCCCR